MKKIAQGLQFNIYLRDDNKIIKIPTSNIQILFKLLSWNPFFLFKPILFKKTIRKTISDRKESIENIQKIKLNKKILANPIFKIKEIEQDKVKVLGKYLKKDFNEAKKYIDKYIDLTFESWSYGFSDKIFNLTINSGIDKFNNVVLIDFGELTFKKKDVATAIKNIRWEKSWSFKRDLNKEIKKYYKNRMKEKLTLSNLDRFWKSH
jgi:hypothetical protein